MIGHRTRNVMIAGRRTSIRLEVDFWSALEVILQREELSLHTLINQIYGARFDCKNLSGAVRVFILGYFFALAERRVPTIPLGDELRTYY